MDLGQQSATTDLLKNIAEAERFNQIKKPTAKQHIAGILNFFELLKNIVVVASEIDSYFKGDEWSKQIRPSST